MVITINAFRHWDDSRKDSFMRLAMRLAERLAEKLLDENDLNLYFDVDWGRSSLRRRFDMVITKYARTNFVAVIEIRQKERNIDLAISRYLDYVFNYTPALLFITYCEETNNYRLFKKDSKDKDLHSIVSFDDVIIAIREASNSIKELGSDSISNFGLKLYKDSTNKLDPNWCRKQLGIVFIN